MVTTLGLAFSPPPGSVEEVIYSRSCPCHAAYIQADHVVRGTAALIREKSQEHGGLVAPPPLLACALARIVPV